MALGKPSTLQARAQLDVKEPCALLGRSEPSDVEDLHVLLQNGGDRLAGH